MNSLLLIGQIEAKRAYSIYHDKTQKKSYELWDTRSKAKCDILKWPISGRFSSDFFPHFILIVGLNVVLCRMKIQNVTMHMTGSVIYTFLNTDRADFQ